MHSYIYLEIKTRGYMFLNILVWFGIGAAIALGVAFVIFLISILYTLYEKIFKTDKKESERQTIDLIAQRANIIIVPTNFSTYLKKTGRFKQIGLFSEESIFEIEKLCSEFWKKDVVLPQLSLCSYDTENFELQIKIEGNEIFKGNFKENLSDEEKLQFIIQKIKEWLQKKEKVIKELSKEFFKEFKWE